MSTHKNVRTAPIEPSSAARLTLASTRAIFADILKRPYITIGMFAFTILAPLAATSNATMIKRMGAAARQRLHRWIYVAAIAVVMHFLMSVKSWLADPLLYAAIVASLLLIRVGFAVRKRT